MQEVAHHYLRDPAPSPWLGHFFVVRNPYTRLESFFRDKFRQDPVTKARAYDELQRCQRFFCAYLQITPTDSPVTIREKLLSLAFDQFVHLVCADVFRIDRFRHDAQFWFGVMEYAAESHRGSR